MIPIEEASQSVNNSQSVDVKEMKAEVRENKIVFYGVNAKDSFVVEKA